MISTDFMLKQLVQQVLKDFDEGKIPIDKPFKEVKIKGVDSNTLQKLKRQIKEEIEKYDI